MKIISIYSDVRDSSSMDLCEKKTVYTNIYTQFSSYSKEFKNISLRRKIFIGDGVLLIFNADSLSNRKEIISLLNEIDDKINNLEKEFNISFGIGISYGEAVEEGNHSLLISNSIDAAAWGSKIANKDYGSHQTWKWVLPLSKGDDGLGSIDEMQNLIENELDNENFKESSSGKNLWFIL